MSTQRMGWELEVAEVDFGHIAVPVSVNTPIGGRIIILGWSLRETSGAASALLLATSASGGAGLEQFSVGLNASGTARDWFGPKGVLLPNGYFPTITGAMSGSMFVALHHGVEL